MLTGWVLTITEIFHYQTLKGGFSVLGISFLIFFIKPNGPVSTNVTIIFRSTTTLFSFRNMFKHHHFIIIDASVNLEGILREDSNRKKTQGHKQSYRNPLPTPALLPAPPPLPRQTQWAAAIVSSMNVVLIDQTLSPLFPSISGLYIPGNSKKRLIF